MVGQKQSNAAGLYDMTGNVWEWCWDIYDEFFYQDSPSQDPRGAVQGGERVCRGGAFTCHHDSAYLTMRGRFAPEIQWEALGFRLARNYIER